MDKAQAIQKIWSSFGLPAYDEQTVPKEATMPYITYSVSIGSFEQVVNLAASVWYRDTSWAEISRKIEEISKAFGEYGYMLVKIDNGYIRLVQGTPFAQRMSDVDSMVRRYYLNVQAEFLTAY